MSKQRSVFSVDVKQLPIVLQRTSFNTSINGTEYLLESRVLQLDDTCSRTEYRVLLGPVLIKDCSKGDVGKYLG